VENIRAAAHQMDELINGLMKYSQMDRRNLTLSAVTPRQIVDILLLDRAEEVQRRALQVDNQLPPVIVRSDYESVYQAINAVIDNAFKFTRTIPAPRIEIGGEDKGRSLLIWVRDNGIGFDMRFHERIYEIFQRLHRLEEYPGTGIGLAMAWKSLQKIGGSIHAESSLGVGTTFYLEIPK
jgi:light-regulated signal transduction histidine kinase (bacteriophytochrome)